MNSAHSPSAGRARAECVEGAGTEKLKAVGLSRVSVLPELLPTHLSLLPAQRP